MTWVYGPVQCLFNGCWKKAGLPRTFRRAKRIDTIPKPDGLSWQSSRNARFVRRLSGFCPELVRQSVRYTLRRLLGAASRLDPYGELIDALRRRGLTYRYISDILTEKCQFHVSKSTINDFVRIRIATKEERGQAHCN